MKEKNLHGCGVLCETLVSSENCAPDEKKYCLSEKNGSKWRCAGFHLENLDALMVVWLVCERKLTQKMQMISVSCRESLGGAR